MPAPPIITPTIPFGGRRARRGYRVKSGADGIKLTPRPRNQADARDHLGHRDRRTGRTPGPVPVSTTRLAEDQYRGGGEEVGRAYLLHFAATALMPSPEIAKVATTKASKRDPVPARCWPRMPNTMSSTVSRAYAPVTALIISQPRPDDPDGEPGGRLPLCPEPTARDSAIPGAPPRLPAIPSARPGRRRGPARRPRRRGPAKFSWYATTRLAPIVSSSTLMLAPDPGREKLAGPGGALAGRAPARCHVFPGRLRSRRSCS